MIDCNSIVIRSYIFAVYSTVETVWGNTYLIYKTTRCKNYKPEAPSISGLEGPNYPLLLCTWFLKNRFGKIRFGKLDFLAISNYIFTACVACKNQFRNWFLEAKNPVCRTWFLQFDFSKIKYRLTGCLTDALLSCL